MRATVTIAALPRTEPGPGEPRAAVSRRLIRPLATPSEAMSRMIPARTNHWKYSSRKA